MRSSVWFLAGLLSACMPPVPQDVGDVALGAAAKEGQALRAFFLLAIERQRLLHQAPHVVVAHARQFDVIVDECLGCGECDRGLRL